MVKIGPLNVQLGVTLDKFRNDMSSATKILNSNVANMQRTMGSLKKGFDLVQLSVAGLIGSQIVQWGAGAVRAFNESERAARGLKSALSSAGIQGSAAIKQLIDNADRLESITFIDDDELVKATATLKQLAPALDVKQLMKGQEAAAGLSEVFGTELNASAVQLGKVLSGTTDTIGRTGLAIKEGGTTAERYTQVMRLLAPVIDQAKAAHEGMAGQVDILTKEMADLEKQVGRTMLNLGNETIKVVGVSDGIGGLEKALKGLNDEYERFAKNQGILDKVLAKTPYGKKGNYQGAIDMWGSVPIVGGVAKDTIRSFAIKQALVNDPKFLGNLVKDLSKTYIPSSKKTAGMTPKLNSMIMPVNGGISSPFGMRGGQLHGGVDIMAGVGTPVRAPLSGEVTHVYTSARGGNTIVLHSKTESGDVQNKFMHLSRFSAQVGDFISQGSVLGYSGGAKGAAGAGNSRGPHLHWEAALKGQLMDPLKLIKMQFQDLPQMPGMRFEDSIAANDGVSSFGRGLANMMPDRSETLSLGNIKNMLGNSLLPGFSVGAYSPRSASQLQAPFDAAKIKDMVAAFEALKSPMDIALSTYDQYQQLISSSDVADKLSLQQQNFDLLASSVTDEFLGAVIPGYQEYINTLTDASNAEKQHQSVVDSVIKPYEDLIQRQKDLQILLQEYPQYSEVVNQAIRENAEAIRGYSQMGSEAARSLGESFSSAFEGIILGTMSVKDAIRGLLLDIAKMVYQQTVGKFISNGISSLIGGIFGGGGGGVGKIAGFASGGDFSAGQPMMVGEEGPELMIPGRSGTIIPNHALGGGGTTILNQYFTIQTIDSRDFQGRLAEHARFIGNVSVEAVQRQSNRIGKVGPRERARV